MKMGNYCIANIYARKPLIQPGDATNLIADFLSVHTGSA